MAETIIKTQFFNRILICMFTLNGYEIIQQRAPKNSVKIYDARHIPSASKVIIHFLPIREPSGDIFENIYQYFLPLKKLFSRHLARVYAIEKISDASASGIAFIIEAIAGQPLKNYLFQNGPLTFDEFIPVAVQIVTAINDLHKAGLSHNGLTSSGIAFDPGKNHICINDFAFGMHAALSPMAGTRKKTDPVSIADEYLPYIAPEQTGRMNTRIDYRTDFYSLGIIFYELLTGTPPFTGNAMALIHAHMAKQPEIPEKIGKEIGDPLSDIILKLLSKSPDQRYQRTFGIKSDLLASRKQAGAGEQLPGFELARHDVSEPFRFPDRIYGREIEIAMLIDEFNRIKENNTGISLITGYSGSEKSRIVEEMSAYVVKKGGYFISGQCEQFQQDIPYSGLIPAFADIIRQILTEPVDRIDNWRSKLKAALGSNASVIVDVLPELEFIIGKQPPVSDLSPKDAQSRFHMVFEKFLLVLAAKAHPLTLFIDNMQWADTVTLKLTESLFIGSEIRNFYFIGTYRNNEISKTHPLFDSIAATKNKGVPVQTISLKPISESDLGCLLSDAFQTDMNEVQLLAQIIFDKTRGNPFFVHQFIETVNRDGFFSYDYENGRWQWDIEQITAQSITDNVVEFMTARVLRLGETSYRMLQLASCIGDSFSLSLLAMASCKTTAEIAANLQEAVAHGLIMPKGDTLRYMDSSLIKLQGGKNPDAPLSAADDITFEFLHDKVRRAVYARVPQALKHKCHLTIGRLIFQHTDKKNLSSRIFSIVHHFEKAEQLFQLLLERAGSDKDRAGLYNQKMIMLASLAKHEEALEIGATGLRLLGVRLPGKAGKPDVLQSLLGLKIRLRHRKIDALIELPEIFDSRLLLTLEMMMNVSLSAYFCQPYLASYLALDIFKITFI